MLQGFGEACLYTGAAAWAVELGGIERSGQALERLRANAGLVKYSTVQQQIRQTNLESLELLVSRTAT